MKISFNQYVIFGLILAIFISFLLTRDIYLSLSLLAFLINFLIFLGCLYVNIIIHEFGHAIELLSKLLAEVENQPRRLFVFNNLAWSYLIKGLNQPEFLNKADEYSAQAFKIGKKSSAVIGTRACVLIETGEIDAGIKLLKPQVSLYHAVNDNSNSVIGFLYLAYAYYLKGNVKQSQKYWQKIKDNQELQSSEYQLLCNHVLKKTNFLTIS